MMPLQTALPLRGLAAAGYATDPRVERAYDWLLAQRLDDGAWPIGIASGHAGYIAGYRRLPGSSGCRVTTEAAIAALVLHPERRRSPETRRALDLLLQRETRDEWALGSEVERLSGTGVVPGLRHRLRQVRPRLRPRAGDARRRRPGRRPGRRRSTRSSSRAVARPGSGSTRPGRSCRDD
jgi:hypothetical protein